jgi:hypothetical protein
MIFKRSEPVPSKDTAPPAVAPPSPAKNASAPAAAPTAPSKAASTPAGAPSSPSKAALPPATTLPMPAAQRDRQTATIRHIDRPDVMETFADSIGGLVFDGQSLRIEFAVTRLDEVKPGAAITGRRYPTCRLVLPPGAAVDLINRMQQIGTALTQAGVARATSRPGEESKTG